MKSTITLSLLVSLGLLTFGFKSDTDPFLELLKKLDTFTSTYPQEKVYIQLDKPYYAVGDDIWLKAYVLNTKSQEPSQLSLMLDVELINEKDEIKASIRLALKDGISWGDFKLPDSLIEGNYRLRAYTPYMRNFADCFFYEKNIKIGNSWSNDVFVNTSFSYAKQKDVTKTITNVQLNDKNEKPYVDKSVGYEVVSGTTVVDKGRARTDETGTMEIAFANQDTAARAGIIKLEISLDRNKIVSKTIPISSFATRSDVQFFPEGGQLVEGHPQKIAIKATGPKGAGVDVTGYVEDDMGTRLTNFRTDYIGMGSFSTNLLANKKYFANVKFLDGSERKIKLPDVSTKGYTLSINNENSTNLTVRVTASNTLASGEEIKIVAQQAGNIRFVLRGEMKSQTLVTSIPKKKFNAGIAQLTIFSQNNIPVAERLVFIKQPLDIVALKLDTAALSNITTGKSHFSFTADELIGSYAVSVTNSNLVAPDLESESNILTSLLLTSDLNGYVEKPNHYFLNDDERTNKELDNLMMTQGWRRFSWKEVAANKTPVIAFKPGESLTVSGIVAKGKKMLPKVPVFLLSKNGGDIVRDTLTDKEGRFNFDNLVFRDSTQFTVQATPLKKGTFLELQVDEPPVQPITANRNAAEMDPNVNGSIKKYISESAPLFVEMERRGFLKKAIQLDVVNITAEKRKKHFEHSANYNGAGNADQVFTADDLPPYYATLDKALGNMMRGLKVVKGRAYSIKSSQGFREVDGLLIDPPLAVYLNGTRLFDGDLERISAMDVQSVEVLTSPSRLVIYGGRDMGGIILVTTKRGSGYSVKKPLDLDFGHKNLQPKGYYIARKFYVPQYNEDKNDTKADYRTTVFWEPNILMDKKGVYHIDFFNTKAAGNYRVVIEGMNKLGQLSRTSFNYTVKSEK